MGHVQSGNVFTEGDMCRVGGYESTLLGYKTRLHKLFKDNLDHIDVLMFGKRFEISFLHNYNYTCMVLLMHLLQDTLCLR